MFYFFVHLETTISEFKCFSFRQIDPQEIIKLEPLFMEKLMTFKSYRVELSRRKSIK